MRFLSNADPRRLNADSRRQYIKIVRVSPRTVRFCPRLITLACHFCKTSYPIDYKDALTMRRFMSGQAKISKRRKTETCAKHQRELSQAIKRARFLGLVPYILH